MSEPHRTGEPDEPGDVAEPLESTDATSTDATSVDARTPVDVAVGILFDADDRFLMTSRPDGKVYAGFWEFPGGKLERGETVEAALCRELHEELGIDVERRADAIERWREAVVDYPHARVRLHFCKVRRWTGAFEMRERQAMRWQDLPVVVGPVLPGAVPVLDWIAAERGFDGATQAPD